MLHALSEAMNTYDPCLAVLVQKGFRITADMPEEGTTSWFAENADVRICAFSPVSLLGLAALWGARGDGWREQSDELPLYDQIL